MAPSNLPQRLNALIPELKSPRLLKNRGIGKEIGYYIFDYEPEQEPLVQQFIPKLKTKLASPPDSLNVLELNLYQIILTLLESRQLLQKAFDLEANKGNATLAKTIKPIIRPEKIVEQISQTVQGNEDLILITGVGASWPILRSHSVLNNLHPILDETPVVMFFPGSYDGHELRLFNMLKDDNYYRAFPLIPRLECPS
jgi:hypothetical protein